MFELSDVRFAPRMWTQHATLIVVACLSLGLGVGATTTTNRGTESQSCGATDTHAACPHARRDLVVRACAAPSRRASTSQC